MSNTGVRGNARWTRSKAWRTGAVVGAVAGVLAYAAISWGWSAGGVQSLGLAQRIALLALVAGTAWVALDGLRPSVRLTPTGMLVVQNAVRRHYVDLGTVLGAHRDLTGLTMLLTDGRTVRAAALNDAVSVADVARRDPRLGRALGLSPATRLGAVPAAGLSLAGHEDAGEAVAAMQRAASRGTAMPDLASVHRLSA